MNRNSSLVRTLPGPLGPLALFAVVFALVAFGVTGCAPAEEGGAPEGGEEQAAEEAGAEEAPAAPQDPEAGTNAIAALQEGSATITGTVTYVGPEPNFQPINMDADPVCAEKHTEPVYPDTLVTGEGGTVANIFVQVKDSFAQGDYEVPAAPVVIDQEGCLYHPHVVGVMAGQPLQFWNSDGILHNVHGTPAQNREFNLGMPASLKEKSVTLNTPEEFVPVKCDVHPWMSAYVAVMTHPYFDVTAEDGQYEITVPPGTYTVEAWHERLGTQTSEITVADGESASVDFELDVPQQ